MDTPTLKEIDHDIRAVRKGLKCAGVPRVVLDSIRTRALKTGRRQTGAYSTNRASRWKVSADNPQFGTERNCKIVLLLLYATMLEFKRAPAVDASVNSILERYLGRKLQRENYRDPLTKERLDFGKLVAESKRPQHGKSEFHLGHENPKSIPRHTPANVGWRSARSNLIQGDLTLAEARTKFVELIARYFELGEVRIEPE